jgi:DNA polymerase-3 subunit beta
MDSTSHATLQVDRRELIAAFVHLSTLADRNGSRPILAHVHASVERGKLRLAATDYDLALELALPFQGVAPGPFLLPALAVLKALRAWPGNTVSIAATEDRVTLTGAGASMPLHPLDPGFFPVLERAPLPPHFTIEASALDRAIECSVPFCQINEARRNLMGVHVVVRPTGVRFEATDGHRGSRRDARAEIAGESAFGDCIIPRAALELWRRVTKGRASGAVGLSWDEERVRLELGDARLTARLIAGKFPNLDPVFPVEIRHHAVLGREALASALAGVSAMSREKIKPVGLRLETGRIILASEPEAEGAAVQVRPADYASESFQIGFNAAYLLDLLKLAQGDQVDLGTIGPLNPSLWAFPDDPGFAALVMPLRIEFAVPNAALPDGPPPETAPVTIGDPAPVPATQTRLTHALALLRGWWLTLRASLRRSRFSSILTGERISVPAKVKPLHPERGGAMRRGEARKPSAVKAPLTPEQRSEIAKKAIATRRANLARKAS